MREYTLNLEKAVDNYDGKSDEKGKEHRDGGGGADERDKT